MSKTFFWREGGATHHDTPLPRHHRTAARETRRKLCGGTSPGRRPRRNARRPTRGPAGCAPTRRLSPPSRLRRGPPAWPVAPRQRLAVSSAALSPRREIPASLDRTRRRPHQQQRRRRRRCLRRPPLCVHRVGLLVLRERSFPRTRRGRRWATRRTATRWVILCQEGVGVYRRDRERRGDTHAPPPGRSSSPPPTQVKPSETLAPSPSKLRGWCGVQTATTVLSPREPRSDS